MSNEPSNSGGNPTPCCLSKGNAAPGAKGNFAPCTLQTNAESPRCPRCGCANATGTVAPGELRLRSRLDPDAVDHRPILRGRVVIHSAP